MLVTLVKLRRESGEAGTVQIKIPVSLLEQAGLDAWGEIAVHAENGRLVIEPVLDDNDLLEMHAEEFLETFRHALVHLGDTSCPID